MKITPLYNYVLIIPTEKEKTTKSGIVLPDSVQEISYKAKVVAVGEGARDDNGDLIPMLVKKGDTILHKSFGLTSVRIEGEEHFILEEKQILAIVEE